LEKQLAALDGQAVGSNRIQDEQGQGPSGTFIGIRAQ